MGLPLEQAVNPAAVEVPINTPWSSPRWGPGRLPLELPGLTLLLHESWVMVLVWGLDEVLV